MVHLAITITTMINNYKSSNKDPQSSQNRNKKYLTTFYFLKKYRHQV